MISTALEFLHARKWLIELLLLAAIAGGVWWVCHHLIEVGMQRERAAWMLKVDAANLETARLRGIAEAAEATGKREHDELTQYMADHPLHGTLASLCKPPRVPAATQTDSGHAGAGAAATPVQPVPEGDSGGADREPDQLGMLASLSARCDALSTQVREYQAR